jgi:hypothetical protein
MSYTVFSGCSYTAGTGFALEKLDPDLWVNQLHDQLFPHTVKMNISKGGRSNAGIFQDTVKSLLTYPAEYAIVQWTSMPRYNLELGFELYDTFQSFMPNGPCRAHNLNNINYSSSYLNSIRDRFTLLAHDCYEIINLIEYTHSISCIAKLSQTRVFFINGLCPWDLNFFNQQTQVLPDQYTKYTQQLLNVETRSDSEIANLYEKMHLRFLQAGAIDPDLWLNLYSSMNHNQSDYNSDQCHPGPESNRLYTKLFCDAISARL